MQAGRSIGAATLNRLNLNSLICDFLKLFAASVDAKFEFARKQTLKRVPMAYCLVE